jgi:hypothetical protein
VESHLTRVNGGHLVRIVGPGFALVREWEAAGIPLSVVLRGIDQKAERHLKGVAARSGRALRIEFCESDVRELFEDWKRAVGITSAPEPPSTRAPEHPSTGAPEHPSTSAVVPSSRRQSLSKHLERVSDRLSRLLGRHDLPDEFLDCVNQAISVVAAARAGRVARGASREEIVASVRPLDEVLIVAARKAIGSAALAQLQQQAEGELGIYKARLAPEAWQQALQATTDRLLRDRLTLPLIDLDVV